jgi:hypothetical protein
VDAKTVSWDVRTDALRLAKSTSFSPKMMASLSALLERRGFREIKTPADESQRSILKLLEAYARDQSFVDVGRAVVRLVDHPKSSSRWVRGI